MPPRDWDASYASGDTPWDNATPDAHLVDFVRELRTRGRALDIGCGTGTNSLHLARQGFEVLGVDLSPHAVALAEAKLAEVELPCEFVALDLMAAPFPGEPYDLVFDRACFHVFHQPDQRELFVRRVAEVLRPGGLWFSLSGSTEGPPREVGPPRRTARELAQAIEPELELVELRAIDFDLGEDRRAAAWWCLSRKRSIPAQPATG